MALAAMTQRILLPAASTPRSVPEILERPIRRRYETGTSATVSPSRAAFTCISTVQPKFLSCMFSERRASHFIALNGPRSVKR